MNIIKGEIGQQLYPFDNSYSYKIRKKGEKRTKYSSGLAGSINEPRKLVTIISPPFKRKIQVGYIIPRFETYEFVQVEYEGEKYVMLNMFLTENITISTLYQDILLTS